MRTFSSGATRNDDSDALDYEGFFSPIVLQEFAKYMHSHRIQADGKLRASDNWMRGIDKDSYIKSLLRHTMDLWLEHRGYEGRSDKIEALCAIMFNAMGYLYEELKNGTQTTDSH